MKKPKHRRVCSRCHQPYWRVNTIAIWTVLTGHRTGNVKPTVKVCTRCFTTSDARRAMAVASVHLVSVSGPTVTFKKPRHASS